MSWMTPAASSAGTDMLDLLVRRRRRPGVAEHVLDVGAALLEADQAQAQVGDRVPDGVVRGLVAQRDEQRPTVLAAADARGGQPRRQLVRALVDLHREPAAAPGEAADGGRAQ